MGWMSIICGSVFLWLSASSFVNAFSRYYLECSGHYWCPTHIPFALAGLSILCYCECWPLRTHGCPLFCRISLRQTENSLTWLPLAVFSQWLAHLGVQKSRILVSKSGQPWYNSHSRGFSGIQLKSILVLRFFTMPSSAILIPFSWGHSFDHSCPPKSLSCSIC